MKRLLPVIAVITLMPVAAYADAPSSYISFGAGLDLTRDSNWTDGAHSGTMSIADTGNFSGALGASYMDNIRTELEVSYRHPDLSSISVDGAEEAGSGKFTTWTYLVNGYYDFMAGEQFRPYLSAGVGAATHRETITATDGDVSGSNTVFAYQGGFGASYNLYRATNLWAGYRYLGSLDSNIDGLRASYGASEFNAGVRFSF